MKSTPLLFTAPMVRALLDGRKTQTRRIVKPQFEILEYPGGSGAKSVNYRGNSWWFNSQTSHPSHISKACPYGTIGDQIWVRETFLLRNQGQTVVYRADMDSVDAAGFGAMYGGWKPSIHMPRWASRISRTLTNVRVERVQDISEEDAEAEGVGFFREHPDFDETLTARELFKVLWEHTYGPDAWAQPWVWVLEFRRLEK